MFNRLKIKTNSINLTSLVGGVAVIALAGLFSSSAPANAASITYSRWSNIGPQDIGDADNGKFTLKITDGADVGQAGKVLFQFSSNTLADINYISEVYFQDKGGLFATTTTTGNNPTTTYNASVSSAFSDDVANKSSLSGLSFDYGAKNLSQNTSIGGFDTSFSFGKSGGGGNSNSISPGETLGVLVDLNTGKTFNDILNGLTQNDSLIVAAHIIGYAGGKSDGFYYGNPFINGAKPPTGTDSAVFYEGYKTANDPNPANSTPVGTAVPEPLTILGAVTAAGFGAAFKRRSAKDDKKAE